MAALIVLSGVCLNIQLQDSFNDSDTVPVSAQKDNYTVECAVLDIAGQGINSTVTETAEIVQYGILINNTCARDVTGVELYEQWDTVGEPYESICSDGILQKGETWRYNGKYTVTAEDIISYDAVKGYLTDDIKIITTNAESKRTVLSVPILYEQHNFTFPSKNYREVGADGHTITLNNNCSAQDPTYLQLLTFILSDTTDTIIYDDNTFVCADYAEKVHNNAEAAGIAAAWVGIDLNGDGASDHACNAFNTVDRGIIYIDCTEGDKLVNLAENTVYAPVTIIEDGYEYEPLGTVKSFEITW